jgi:LuxR family maltose regulon positive regulatory protein
MNEAGFVALWSEEKKTRVVMTRRAPASAKSFHSTVSRTQAAPTCAATGCQQASPQLVLTRRSTMRTLRDGHAPGWLIRVDLEHDAEGTAVEPGAVTRSVDPFLEAKLHHPPVREDWVDRARLLQQLDSATRCRVALVAAPAGYGKTTLVAQWLAGKHDPRATAWVSLDSGDNDPGRLWTHVATALERAGCSLAPEVVRLVSTATGGAVESLLARMVNALAAMPHDVVILLDDFHCVHERACHDQFEFLVENLPSQAHLVIITRADPGLRLGRVRASGQLAEIRADDLCFTADEAAVLLGVEHVRLSLDSVSQLMQRTEGWPAGIYLACLSLAGRDDPDEFVQQFSGGNRFIGDYLTEEVLSRHPDEVREFITTVSFLDRFSAPLCDFVSETTHSAAILHDLERGNLFLVPLDAERRWFRFHHLFAAVARAELEAEHPDRMPELHARAARWFGDRGHIDEAVRHSLAGGRATEAALLVQANWITYVDAGRAPTVRAWLEALGPPSVARDPAAGVAAAWLAAFHGDEADLTQRLKALEGHQDYGPLPDGTRSVGSAIAMIRGLFGYGGPVEMLASAQRAVELETDGRSPFYSLAHLALGHAAYVSGDLNDAASLLETARHNESAPGIIRVLSLSALSLVEAERGRQDRSRELARSAMEIVDDRGLGATPQSSLAFTALGRALADAGRVEEAMSTLEQGLLLQRRNREQGPWGLIHHLLVTSRVALVTSHRSLAQELTTEASERMGHFQDGMAPMTAKLHAIQEDIGAEPAGVMHGDPLTDRELDVLRLLQGQLSLPEIAVELYVSANTVKTHTSAVYRKLGAHSRIEAVRIARHHLLI